MLLMIPGVLKQDEVETVMRELSQGAYEDGRASASLVTREVKNNLRFEAQLRLKKRRVRLRPARRCASASACNKLYFFVNAAVPTMFLPSRKSPIR